MTGTIGNTATNKVIARVGDATAGIWSTVAPDPAQVRTQNVSTDLAERTGSVKYPALYVYCEKVINDLTEKFRSFSGRVQMAIEIRHSQDRLEGLQDVLELYADATTQSLNASRGDWGDGMFYSGGYEVAFGAAKHGGKNFIQVAKVTFEIQVSRN